MKLPALVTYEGKFTGQPDSYWLYYLKKPGHYLSGKNVVTVKSIGKIVDLFKNKVAWVAAWDATVAATSNVASTAAGVENLLPMRYDQSIGVYDWFVRRNKIFTVKRTS